MIARRLAECVADQRPPGRPDGRRRVRHPGRRRRRASTTRWPWRRRRWPRCPPRCTSATSSSPSRPASASSSARSSETSASELMKAADTTLYWAKAEGRGRWAVYDPERSARDIARSALVAGLPAALDRGEFVLHYQPIVSLLDGTMLAVEALVRWQHPELGLIGPDRFIGLAEETGLIVRLGEWVLRRACRDAERVAAAVPATPGWWSASTWPPGRPTTRPSWTTVADALDAQRPPRRPAAAGADRERRDGHRRGAAAVAAPAGRAGRTAGHRRLRHRLLEPGVPAPAADPLPEAGRAVRGGDPRRRAGRRRPTTGTSGSSTRWSGWRTRWSSGSPPRRWRPGCRPSGCARCAATPARGAGSARRRRPPRSPPGCAAGSGDVSDRVSGGDRDERDRFAGGGLGGRRARHPRRAGRCGGPRPARAAALLGRGAGLGALRRRRGPAAGRCSPPPPWSPPAAPSSSTPGRGGT